jgi:hypothetical protein
MACTCLLLMYSHFSYNSFSYYYLSFTFSAIFSVSISTYCFMSIIRLSCHCLKNLYCLRSSSTTCWCLNCFSVSTLCLNYSMIFKFYWLFSRIWSWERYFYSVKKRLARYILLWVLLFCSSASFRLWIISSWDCCLTNSSCFLDFALSSRTCVLRRSYLAALIYSTECLAFSSL